MLEKWPMRINKFLALHLGVSRREADDLVQSGKVEIDGVSANNGSRVEKQSHVLIDGKAVNKKQQFTTILFNKPVGYVCSRKRQGDNPTIYELLPEKYHQLKPVGRLDKDSSGILLLTDDGDLAHSLTHPKFRKIKIYEVSLDKPLEPLHRQMISDFGVDLPDGRSKFMLERSEDGNEKKWRVTMHEGRNRQIRRTFAALGYDTTRLHRTQFGRYSLEKLESEKYSEQ